VLRQVRRRPNSGRLLPDWTVGSDALQHHGAPGVRVGQYRGLAPPNPPTTRLEVDPDGAVAGEGGRSVVGHDGGDGGVDSAG